MLFRKINIYKYVLPLKTKNPATHHSAAGFYLLSLRTIWRTRLFSRLSQHQEQMLVPQEYAPKD